MAKVDWNALEQEFKRKHPSRAEPPVAGANISVANIAGDAWEQAQERARIHAREREVLGFTDKAPGYESIDPNTGQQFTSPPPPEEGLIGTIKARMLGTDVPQDPAVLPRLTTTIAGSVGSGLAAERLLRPAGRALQSVPYAPVKAFGAALPYVGAYLASGAGAAYGSRLPEDMTSLMEYAGVVPRGTREKNLLNDEELKIIMRGELITDMAFGGVLSAAKHTYRTGSRLLQLAGRSSQEQAAAAKELGIEIPGTASAGSFFERIWTPVFARIPMWGGPITSRAKLSSAQMIDVLNMKIMGPIVSDTEIGRRLFEGAAETVKEFNKKYSDQYTAVWKRMDEAGARINPKLLRDEAQEILNEIAQRAVRTGKEAPGDQALRKFIMEKIISNKSALSGQEVTMMQMDGFLKDTFQTKAFMAKKGRHANAIFERLRQAAIANTVDEGSLFSREGASAGEIKVLTEDLKSLNQKFGREVRALFETTGALKFGRFQKGGIRSVGSPKATTSAIDEVAKAFKDSDSPQVMRELKALMPPDVFEEFIELRLKQAYEAAVKVTTKEGEEFQIFNPAAFREKLGLNSPKSGKHEVTEFLIENSSRLSMRDLNTFLKSAEEIQKMDVPNPYQMAQRRAGLGGIAAAVGAFTVGSGITGYAGHSVTGGSITGAVVGAILAVLPARGISNLLANPRAALPIRNMISESATNTRKLKSALQLVRLSVTAGIEKGDITREDGEEFYRQMRSAIETNWGPEKRQEKREPSPMGVSPYDDIRTPPPPDPLHGQMRPQFQNPNRVIPTPQSQDDAALADLIARDRMFTSQGWRVSPQYREQR